VARGALQCNATALFCLRKSRHLSYRRFLPATGSPTRVVASAFRGTTQKQQCMADIAGVRANRGREL